MRNISVFGPLLVFCENEHATGSVHGGRSGFIRGPKKTR